jgi:solute carrier family 30 (zinc transporter), member 1
MDIVHYHVIGAFFNGVFLIALALSIFFQSIERFISLEIIDNPLWVIIVGGVGLVLNILSASVVHSSCTTSYGAAGSLTINIILSQAMDITQLQR